MFFYIRLFDCVHYQYLQLLEIFLFFEFLDFSCFRSSIPSNVYLFRYPLLALDIFICQISSICHHCISSLPDLGFPILLHSWRIVWTLYIRRFIFPWNSITITKSNGDSVYPSTNILQIFTPAKIFNLLLSFQWCSR